jgi:hypothetical protein
MSALRLLILAAVTAALAPAAEAATVEHTAGTGPANEQFLVFRAAQGERNRLTVTDSSRGIVFTDPGARLHGTRSGFGGCRFSHHRHRATCKVPRYLDLEIHLGDRGDSLRFRGSNGGALGPTERTDVKDAATLGDRYEDLDGANYEHAIVFGGEGNDLLRGTASFDLLDAGKGADRVDGGRGNDRIADHPDGATDTLLGGRGVDTVDGDGGVPLAIDLGAGTLEAGAETDTLDSFERARGGTGNDTLTGTGDPDGLFGDNGADVVDGGGGNDYLGGDLNAPQHVQSGKPGRDRLTGGAGDDVLDGRDSLTTARTPTDGLVCGDGADRIVAVQDDLADPTCESSAFGVFGSDPYFAQAPDFKALSGVAPVARGSDGAPTYEIACPAGTAACNGRVQLEEPPASGAETPPRVYGSGDFTIPAGGRADVPVVLNAAGKAALAVPGARASVNVLAGFELGHDIAGQNADFGWQQVLTPSG